MQRVMGLLTIVAESIGMVFVYMCRHVCWEVCGGGGSGGGVLKGVGRGGEDNES